MPELSDLSLLCFDLDQTLIDRDAAARRYFEALMERHPAAFRRADRAATLREILDVDDGGRRPRKVFFQWLVRTFPALPLTPAALYEDFQIGLPEHIECPSHVLRLLARYARRYDLVLITNGTSRMQRAKLRRARLEGAFREVLISEEIGAAKPDPAIFRRALASTGTVPNRALMIGDSLDKDIEGARRVGLRTCWVSQKRRLPPDRRPPDLTIATVRELPEVLPCP